MERKGGEKSHVIKKRAVAYRAGPLLALPTSSSKESGLSWFQGWDTTVKYRQLICWGDPWVKALEFAKLISASKDSNSVCV